MTQCLFQLGLLLLLPALVTSGAPAAAPASVAGTWNLATNVAGNTGTPSCTFKQEAEKVTGTCTSGTNSTPLEAAGEVTDTKITFRYVIDWEGQALTLIFSGTLDSPTEMKGTLDVQPVGVTGDFTGKKAS
jgi:hypothetical protein